MATILLAEDEAAIRDMLHRALSNDGHEVIAAADGQAALTAVTGRQIDVLVSDISMPEMDGVTLAEQMLALQPGLSVILMSAIADEITRAQALSSGSVKVLNKPVSLERMCTEVGQLLKS